MKTKKQIQMKIAEVKEAIRVSENSYEYVSWVSSMNALEWVLEQ